MSKKTRKELTLKALTHKQSRLIQDIQDNEMVIVTGPAGVGKTYCIASLSAQYLKAGVVKQIIFSRPVVSCGKSLGFMPGTEEEKLEQWTRPFMNVIRLYFSETEIDMFIKSRKITTMAFEAMRGSSFDDAFIILDECQNASVKECKMFVTRTGKRSKTVLSGDITQSDIRDSESGLEWMKMMAKKYKMNIPRIEFNSDDIVRSDTCKMWVKAMEEEVDTALPSFISGDQQRNL